MKRFLLHAGLLPLAMLLAGSALAQSACTQTLRTARSTYDLGRLHDLPDLLESCLKNGFTDQEKVEAYKLLTLTYIYLEEPAKADEAMLDILRTDPYFQVNNEVDPAEFISLYKTFRTHPIYRLGINLGVNASQPNVVSAIEAIDGEGSYSYKIAFQFGLVTEVPLTNRFTLNPGISFQQKSFSYTNRVNRGENEDGKPLYNNTQGQEKQAWMSMPVMLQYQIKQGRYNPYVAAGISVDYLLQSEMTIERTRDNAAAVPEKSMTLKPQRENLNASAILAAGSKLRIFGGYFVTEVRFQYGLLKVNSTQTAYANQELVFTNGYADSVYKINSISITIGYVQSIFNPKKLNRKK